MAEKRRAYAETTVAVVKSQAEIRGLLLRYGAEQFGILEEENALAVIGFKAHGRTVRVEVPLPNKEGGCCTATGKWLNAHSPGARSFHEQEERRIWRAARAWIYTQLEAVESGIKTFEDAFLADTVVPGGRRLVEWIAPVMEEAEAVGRMPSRLTLGDGPAPWRRLEANDARD